MFIYFDIFEIILKCAFSRNSWVEYQSINHTFAWLTDAPPPHWRPCDLISRQGVGVVSSRRFLDGVGVGFFVRLRLRKSNWIIFYITLLSWEFLLKWHNFFWNFCWNRFLAVHHGFHWFSQQNFTPFMLRYRSRKFWKGRSRRIFYLWLRNPGFWSQPPNEKSIVSIKHWPTLYSKFCSILSSQRTRWHQALGYTQDVQRCVSNNQRPQNRRNTSRRRSPRAANHRLVRRPRPHVRAALCFRSGFGQSEALVNDLRAQAPSPTLWRIVMIASATIRRSSSRGTFSPCSTPGVSTLRRAGQSRPAKTLQPAAKTFFCQYWKNNLFVYKKLLIW